MSFSEFQRECMGHYDLWEPYDMRLGGWKFLESPERVIRCPRRTIQRVKFAGRGDGELLLGDEEYPSRQVPLAIRGPVGAHLEFVDWGVKPMYPEFSSSMDTRTYCQHRTIQVPRRGTEGFHISEVTHRIAEVFARRFRGSYHWHELERTVMDIHRQVEGWMLPTQRTIERSYERAQSMIREGGQKVLDDAAKALTKSTLLEQVERRGSTVEVYTQSDWDALILQVKP